MAYPSGAGTTRGFGPRARKLDFAPEGSDWDTSEAQRRDVKKLILIIGLGALSWVATYIGMLELIQANMGDLPFVHKAIIGFSVAMLMTMIIWLLDQMFAPIGFVTRLSYVFGYLLLTLISVGFGFGFYWKVLESRSEASRSAESAVGQVQGSLHAASTRLEQLQATLVQLAAVSREKAELEQSKGTSCPNSRPGDGPRRKMRDEDAARFSFASDLVAGRVGAIKGDMAALDGDLAKISSGDTSTFDARSGTRNEFMKALGRKLDLTVTGFNAFRTDPQLKQLRADLAERADKTSFGDAKGNSFVCPDPQLSQALRGAVRAIDQLPELEKPQIAAVEGSEATVEAFRRLTATLFGLIAFKLPPSADELRELQQKAVQTVEGGAAAQRALKAESAGLSKRDYIPLTIAIFVDLCLLLVSMGRPMNRLNSLIPRMREAERGPVSEILSRFKDIHRDPEIRESFEVFRHVVFDFHGDYYVAVPLDAPYRYSPRQAGPGAGTGEDQELQHEAHLLANLFSSFEKERIFRRVYNPLLLGTASIQKKLVRQGSKFAACKAFRIYKFRNGAWSEFILGAVMGAARRAEAERRGRRLEEELMRPRGPAFGALEDEDRASFAAMRREPELRPARSGVARAAELRGSGLSVPAADPPIRASEASAAHSAKFGPYASLVKSASAVFDDETDTPIPDAAPPAANSNTMTGADPRQDRFDQEAKVDVVLRRDTATISVPVSEAMLPQSLSGLIDRVAGPAAPAALPAAIGPAHAGQVASEPATEEAWDEHDARMIGRFAAIGAAE